MSKNAAQWAERPRFPATHYVDSRIYTDEQIFRDEQERIFGKTWYIGCHESELPNVYDYRTFQHPAGVPLVMVRGEDNKVRTFYNICPHRGNTLLYDPVGSAKRITCIFHSWSFDTKGSCIDITREKEGYQDRFCKGDSGMREVRTEVAYGGFVWVNLDDECGPLSEFIGEALSELEPYMNMPLEIFHYHRAVVNTNFKLWHDTNSEFYHDYMHYFNRVTGMLQPGYFDRKCVGYPNGHVLVGSMEIQYDAYVGSRKRGVGWPGLSEGGWILIDLFPGMTYNLRTSVIRMDTMTPLGPNKVAIEYRGLGIKSDTEEERAERVRDHNTIWGPFGRNLHEDLLGVSGQGRAMREGTGSRWVLHGREEHYTIHDEVGMRHYYAEWSRRMRRKSYDPFGEQKPESNGEQKERLAVA